jgi:ABC-type transporter Mla subunit MlaD
VAFSARWKAEGLAAVLGLAYMGNVACADPCQKILDDLKRLVDNVNRDISSTLANLQEATGRTTNDKQRLAMVAQNCAASAEAFGTFKSYRVVLVACVDEHDASSRDVLDKLDRSISQIRVSLDKACH